MRNFTKLLLTAALFVVGVGGAKVNAAKTIGTEYTSVAALEGKAFAIVNKTDGKAIFNSSGFDLGYDVYATAFSKTGFLFKIESASSVGENCFYLRALDANGNPYGVYGDGAYFQSNKKDDSHVCFYLTLGIGTGSGADAENTAVWEIQYDGVNNGFTLLNKGTGKYYNDPTKDAMSDTPGYFTFCEVVEGNPTLSINNSASIAETLTSNPENFTEITQENVETGFTAATKTVGADYTTYNATGNLQFAIKTLNVDVAGCDYVIIKFAEAVPAGWVVAFWEGQANEPVAEGSTEYKLVFSEDTHKDIGVKNGVLPQITLMTRPWGEDVGNISAKVAGIYKHTASDYSRTYSFDKALDFTDVEGLKAYVISAYDKSTATLTLTEVTKVPANTGLYIVGKGGDYEIPVIASADPISTNLLKPSGDGTITKTDGGSNTNLVLAGTGANRGFHPLSEDGNMGANKAYLQLPTADLPTSGTRLNIVFDNGTTGINTVQGSEFKVNGEYYDLQGRRVAQPTKGLYIQNGRKVLVK